MITGDHHIVAGGHVTARHEQHVTRCSANLHRDQVAFVSISDTSPVNRLTVEIQGPNGSGRATEQQTDRTFCELVDRGRAAVRLHQ